MLKRLLVVLWLARVAALCLHFANSRSFYHDLDEESIEFILHNSNLLDDLTVKGQDGLLADRTVGISNIYNHACGRITEERAGWILELAQQYGKGFEERWLGITCITDVIIRVRTARGEWPPRQIPLLVAGFSFQDRTPDYQTSILEEALRQPQHWYSLGWIREIDLGAVSTKYWRIISPATLYKRYLTDEVADYLKQSLFENFNPSEHLVVEQVFIKSISMLPFLIWFPDRVQTVPFLHRVEALWLGLGRVRVDAWTKQVLKVLGTIDFEEFKVKPFLRSLLASELLNVAFWIKFLDEATAISNVMKLLIFSILLTSDAIEIIAIKFRISSLLKDLNLLSVCPLVFRAFVECLKSNHYRQFIDQYAQRWISDSRLFIHLHDRLPLGNRVLEAVRSNFYCTPLMQQFKDLESAQELAVNYYDELLYTQWLKDKNNWPGMMIAYEQTKNEIRENLQLFEPDTFDPKVDKAYPRHHWEAVLSLLVFELWIGVPGEMVPSICFFEALLYYHRDIQHFRWSRMQTRYRDQCHFPTDAAEKPLYLHVLQVAVEIWKDTLDLLNWIDAKSLHKAMCSGRREREGSL